MDYPNLTLSNFMEKSTGLQRVNIIFKNQFQSRASKATTKMGENKDRQLIICNHFMMSYKDKQHIFKRSGRKSFYFDPK